MAVRGLQCRLQRRVAAARRLRLERCTDDLTLDPHVRAPRGRAFQVGDERVLAR